MITFTLITKNSCPACQIVKNFLNGYQHATVKVVNVDNMLSKQDEELCRKLVSENGGTYPLLIDKITKEPEFTLRVSTDIVLFLREVVPIIKQTVSQTIKEAMEDLFESKEQQQKPVTYSSDPITQKLLDVLTK